MSDDRRATAPLEPAAVKDANVLPAHEPGIEERQRRAPPCAAIERDVQGGVNTFLAPELANVFGG